MLLMTTALTSKDPYGSANTAFNVIGSWASANKHYTTVTKRSGEKPFNFPSLILQAFFNLITYLHLLFTDYYNHVYVVRPV